MKLSNRNLVKRITLLVAAGSLAVTGQTWAAEPEYQLDQVTVTATRVAQPVTAVAADVTVITAEQIEAKGAKTLADTLDGVAGVTLFDKGGPGNKTILYVNGTERVLVLIDGKRMNLPQGLADGALNIDLNNITAADNIEKIEVIRGGSSVLYGSDAIGGIINIITKKGTISKTTLATEYGNYGTWRQAISSQGSDSGFKWYVNGTFDASDGQRPNSESKGTSWSGRFDKDIDTNKNISLTYDYVNSRGEDPGVLKNGVAQFLNKHTYDRRSIGVDFRDSKDGQERVLRIYNNEQNRSMTDNYGTHYQNDNTVRAFEYQGTKKMSDFHLVTWGTELRASQVRNHFDNYNEKETVRAAYLQDQYALTDKFSLTGGLRYENNSKYGSQLIPKISAVYNVNPTTSYFANWGQVFRTPLFDDVYTPQVLYPAYFPGDPDYAVGGNRNLKPETGWTAETGVKKKLSDNSEMSVAFFYRDLTDMIRWNSQLIGNTWIYQPINVDHATTSGLNASFKLKLTPVVTTTLDYTYIHEHDLLEGAFVQPTQTFRVGIVINKNKFRQTISGRYVGDSVSGTGSYRKNVSSYFVVDTSLNYDLNERQSIFAHVSNIANRKYETYAYYPAQERSFTIGFKQTF